MEEQYTHILLFTIVYVYICIYKHCIVYISLQLISFIIQTNVCIIRLSTLLKDNKTIFLLLHLQHWWELIHSLVNNLFMLQHEQSFYRSLHPFLNLDLLLEIQSINLCQVLVLGTHCRWLFIYMMSSISLYLTEGFVVKHRSGK